MSDQSKLGLGQIITTEQQRDAIHVAVAPVVAGEMLHPGDHVGFLKDGRVAEMGRESIGVIDPFLRERYIEEGQRVWLFLYPGSITSLRHDWTHPSFTGEPQDPNDQYAAKSEDFIREWSQKQGYEYSNVMGILRDAIESGGACAGDDCDQDRFNDSKEKLLHHAAIVLKREPVEPDSVYFSCSC